MQYGVHDTYGFQRFFLRWAFLFFFPNIYGYENSWFIGFFNFNFFFESAYLSSTLVTLSIYGMNSDTFFLRECMVFAFSLLSQVLYDGDEACHFQWTYPPCSTYGRSSMNASDYLSSGSWKFFSHILFSLRGITFYPFDHKILTLFSRSNAWRAKNGFGKEQD